MNPKRPKHIVMLLDEPFPPDARVEREMRALVAAGYRVTLMCTQRPEDLSEERLTLDESVSIDIVRLAAAKRPAEKAPWRNVFQIWQDQWAWATQSLDKRWFRAARPVLQRLQPDALHVHDLRLLPTANKLQKALKIPHLISDLHENYPALLASLCQNNPQKARKRFQKWQKIERQCLPQASHVITVIDEARDRLISDGLPPDHVSVVGNTVDVNKFLAVTPNLDIVQEIARTPSLVYVGHINAAHRGIHTAIDALASLSEAFPDLRLILAGATRPAYQQQLLAQAEALGVGDRLVWTGSLKETDFVHYIVGATLCLCPHLKDAQTQATFPNKLPLYHLFNKAVIASNCTPLARYVAETQGGLTFEAGKAASLAVAIETLLQDPERAQAMADRGRAAVLDRHNWRTSAKTLITLYAGLFRDDKTGF